MTTSTRSLLAITALLAMSGCMATQGRVAIDKAKSIFGGSPKVEASAPADAQQPTTVSQGERKTDTEIAAGTRARIPVKVNGQSLLMEFEFPEIKQVSLERVSEATVSPPRPPDQAVALRKLDNEDRRPLLYCSIGAAVLAVASLYFRYPGPAALCGAASAGFFAAWRLSDLPSWFWAVALAAVAVAAGLYLGHERGEQSSKTTQAP